MDNEQFLEDWDLFEQEAGNYAHIIEPAAKPKNAAARPFGGDETNTIPTDPYPAQPNDRKLESCMDNLAQQILDLNQSLSLSHIDRRASMSLSARRRQSTEPGTLAAAGSEMTQATAIEEEDEFDPDGGDGRDDEADQNQSTVITEKLSESIAASHELSSSIRELIAEQRARLSKGKEEEDDDMPAHVKPHGERAAHREALIEENEAAKAATEIDNTPQAKAALAGAAAALKTMDLTFQVEPSTPMSPANREVQSMTPAAPTKPFTIAELQQHKAAIAAQHKLYMETANDKEALQRAHQRELAAIDAYIAANLESESVNLADSGTPVVPLEQSSSEGTPLGIVAARQRMRDIALAPTKGKKVVERDSDGEIVEGKELGFGDSEGSSAALSEHSSDRDFVAGDSSDSSSANTNTAQENTTTISDGSEIADSLMDVSAIMQASDDASYEPAAKEVAKAAVAVQHAVTQASKAKEEEMKKQARKKGVAFDV